MRGQYLFDLAHICHMGARQVDALCYYDFCNYILQIDQHHKNEEERWKALNNHE